MISRAEYDEFFSTDSIRRKNELRDLINDAIDEAVHLRFGKSLEYWCFPNAYGCELGTMEKFIEEDGFLIEYNLGLTNKSLKTTVILLKEVISDCTVQDSSSVVCSVISTIDGAVCANQVFIGERDAVKRAAEQCFVDMVRDETSFGDDIDKCLQDGCVMEGNLYICINWGDLRVISSETQPSG